MRKRIVLQPRKAFCTARILTPPEFLRGREAVKDRLERQLGNSFVAAADTGL